MLEVGLLQVEVFETVHVDEVSRGKAGDVGQVEGDEGVLAVSILGTVTEVNLGVFIEAQAVEDANLFFASVLVVAVDDVLGGRRVEDREIGTPAISDLDVGASGSSAGDSVGAASFDGFGFLKILFTIHLLAGDEVGEGIGDEVGDVVWGDIQDEFTTTSGTDDAGANVNNDFACEITGPIDEDVGFDGGCFVGQVAVVVIGVVGELMRMMGADDEVNKADGGSIKAAADQMVFNSIDIVLGSSMLGSTLSRRSLRRARG